MSAPPPANDNPAPDGPAPVPGRPCPICGKPRVEKYKPFCSKRCADVDLGRWLGGRYAVPVTHDDEDEDGTGGDTSSEV